MQRHPTAVSQRRRVLLSGLTVSGLAVLLAGCERSLPIVTPSLAAAPTRRPQPAPLAPVTPPDAPTIAVGAVFGRVVCLEGVTIDRDTVQPGDYLRIWLYWQSDGVSQEDLRSVGQVVADGWRVVASEDDQIGRRRHFLSRWAVGDRGVDEMRIRIGPSVGLGEYGLAVGVLRPDNQTHVPLTSRLPAASVWSEDAVLVGSVQVQSA